MFKNGVKSKVLFFMVFSLILTLTFVLGNTDTSYAETGEELQLFTNEELQEIEDYMNENMNELNDENLGVKQTGIVELENGDEVEITVTNEIDTEGISPMTTVSPGQNRVFTVTKNRTGFFRWVYDNQSGIQYIKWF